jgi:lipoyl-dependent peroxiredoxin
MKTVITSEAVSVGGRSGSVQSPDGMVKIDLGNPLDAALKRKGPNPEHLFAAAYAACYHGALLNAAKKLGTQAKDTKVRAVVNLREDDSGGYNLAVELHGEMPGVERGQAQRVMEEAHKTCPYSKAMRGEAAVKLVVDWLR